MLQLIWALFGYFVRAVGRRTDAASATGSLHAKVKDVKDSVAEMLRPIIASSTLVASADTERNKINDLPMTKVKEIRTGKSGTCRVSFDFYQSSASPAGYGQLYKNGVAVGTQRTGNTSYQTFTEDIAVQAGDLIQVYYGMASTGQIVYVRNFRLLYDVAEDTDPAVTLD